MGFIKHQQVGSHLTLKHPVSNKRAVVPMHLRDLKKGTLLGMLREADVDRDEFIAV